MKNFREIIIRFIDILASFLGFIILLPFIIIIFILIYKNGKEPFFYQERLGKNMKKFILIKFRTMAIGTENCATHLVDATKITKLGKFLRKTKLDEIPQLYNVFRGEMSFVGPRPSLPNQDKLINWRKRYNLYNYKPGITGLSQIKKIDMSEPELLAKTDNHMMKNLNIKSYLLYIFMTIFGKGYGDRIKKINYK
tara:strand:- start:516 stop:1100 length:585 start_codon:yes stop_codon:yes gene_type:complete